MGKIKEYLTLQKAKELKKILEGMNEYTSELIYTGDYDSWELKITEKSYSHKELEEADLFVIMRFIFDNCKRYYINLTLSRYGKKEIYVSIKVKE